MLRRRSAFCLCRPNSACNDVRDSGSRESRWAEVPGSGQVGLRVGLWPAGYSARIAALRLPAPLTCFAFGIVVAGFFKPLVNDSVISYLATLGIAARFSLCRPGSRLDPFPVQFAP